MKRGGNLTFNTGKPQDSVKNRRRSAVFSTGLTREISEHNQRYAIYAAWIILSAHLAFLIFDYAGHRWSILVPTLHTAAHLIPNVLIAAGISVYLAVHYLWKLNGRETPRLWGYLIFFLAVMSAVDSGLDQLTNGQIANYILSIILLSSVFVFSLRYRVLLFTSAHLVFLSLLYLFRTDPAQFSMNCLYGSFTVILAYALAWIRFGSITKVYTDRSEYESRNRLLEKQNRMDSLTEVFNRGYLEMILPDECSRSQTSHCSLSVAIMDVDSFKAINDEHSHHIGDLVLKEISWLIRKSCRQNDMIFRYGGDEFVLLLPATSVGEATAVCSRIRSAIEEFPWEEIDDKLSVTASFGVAAHISGYAAEAVLRLADRRLYEAKFTGKNRVVSDNPAH